MHSRIKHTIKLTVLGLARACGLFGLARWCTRDRIRILCYHGMSVVDEHRFRPALFMQAATFRSRLQALRDGGYDVLTLDDAVDRIESRRRPRAASVVITIDDGFRQTGEQALPLLAEFGMPATVYVTSYYAAQPVPIPTLAVQYLLWKSERSSLDLSKVTGADDVSVDLRKPEGMRTAIDRLVAAVKALDSEPERQALLDRLGDALGVPVQPLREDGRLSLMSGEAVREAAAAGVDIQLHTHRHVLPLDDAGVRREIDDNRAFLEPLATRPLRHFCYPSGEWDPRHWEPLERAGVRSATTCVPGMNAVGAPPMALSRFVDQDDVHPLEFEAEISGFAGALRALKRFPALVRGQRRAEAAASR